MKIKNIIIYIVVLLINLVNVGVDFKDYEKLKINNVASIKASDLPQEFGEGAFRTVDEFIRISNPYDLKLVCDFVKNPELKVNKAGITEFFAKMNIEIDADELADAMQRHSKEYLIP